MSSFIKDWLIEINQYPRSESGDTFSIKDYFYYDSNIQEYGYRDIVIPLSTVLNKEEVPDKETIQILINSKIPIIRRVIDLNNQEESWIFDTNVLKEIKK